MTRRAGAQTCEAASHCYVYMPPIGGALSSASYQNAPPLGFTSLHDEEEEGEGTQLSAEAAHRLRLVRAATYVQRAVRIHNMIFGHFARVIFARKNGRSSDHGVLQFPAHGTEAQFLTIADTTPASLIVPFLIKVWKLPPPEIIISVTGGAQALTLDALLQEEFNKGLVSAATAAHAWVITGGTDTGVMHLVGKAMHDAGVDGKVPLLGISAHGAVNNRDKFDSLKFGRAVYQDPDKPSVDGAPISPHHSHFLFIDSGREQRKAWGSEIVVRAEIEQHMMKSRAVPMVLLVVQGGPGTLATVLANAKLGCPVVLLSNSGGAASAVSRFVQDGGLDEELDAPFMKPTPLEQLEQIRSLHEASGDKLLSFFNVGAESMATSMLQAIVANLTGSPLKAPMSPPRPFGDGNYSFSRPSAGDGNAPDLISRRSSLGEEGHDSFAKALLLAVRWDRPEIAKPILAQIEARGLGFAKGTMKRALQAAISLERLELLRLFMASPGFEAFGLPGIALAQLYS